MISFFPGFYKDENVYSVLGRCGDYCCLKSYREAIKSAFGDDNTLPTLEFPCKLSELAATLEYNDIDVNSIILNHTMFPLYSPFLPVERQSNITNKMVYGSGKGIKSEIGFLAGSICKKTGLYYCPICSSEEFEFYGEAYLHRLHQAQGVFVCGKHQCFLKEYSIRLIDASRLSFIKLERDQLDFNCEIEINGNKLETMLKISSSVEFLLNNDLSYVDKMIVEDSYRKQLKKSGFTTISGRIHQQDLCKAIKDFFGDSILNTFESSIDIQNEYNWVRVLTRKGSRVVHPIRHLLFIDFLFGDVKVFIDNLNESENKPLRYPCLNPASEHYRQLVIKDVLITADYKTREPVGTFKCDCGFTYSRKMDSDIFRVGRIKEFGQIWESKLETLILDQNHTVTSIARELRCDYKTVVKYAAKLGLKHFLNTNMAIEYKPIGVPEVKRVDLSDGYKKTISDYIKENPNTSYIEVRAHFPKEFSYIYNHDSNWIRSNLPRSQKPIAKTIDYNLWAERDVLILDKLRNILSSLSLEEGSKVTRTMLMRKTGMQATIEKNINKLPLCKRLLDSVSQRNKTKLD